MKHQQLTGQIIGAAMTVLNELRPGLDEKLYENALVIELAEQGLISYLKWKRVIRGGTLPDE
jgi:GxxExxY protein